jgi:branched-chain amino acid transport system substrate-binding protein
MSLILNRRTLGTAALGALAAPTLVRAQSTAPIRLGSIATLEGPFAAGGQDANRAIQLALDEVNSTVAGRRIEWIRESSNAQADVALARARKLIEQDNVEIIVGPLSGAEGLALRDYSRTLVGRTIVNGQSAAADTTLRDLSPNFFRFNMDGGQWIYGLGTYVAREMNHRNVCIVAGDYAFPYTQVMAFMLEFCRAGGEVSRLWSPLGTSDYGSVIARIPREARALLVIHGGTDALAFLTQYAQAGGNLPIIAGPVTADQTVMSARGPHRRMMNGMISAAPFVDDSEEPSWVEFVQRYRRRFPDGLQSPSINAVHYYVNTKAVLLALALVNGDLSGNQVAFQRALAGLSFRTPMGSMVRLDHNRQAISDNFIRRVVERGGQLRTEQVAKYENVTQTLGLTQERFLALGSASRDNPASCQVLPS